jgi:thiamine biosynthesis protein ThiS
MNDTMDLTVNGKTRQAEPGASILTFLEANGIDPRIVAVEQNGQIVKRDDWGVTPLAAGDTLEIVRMVGGG